MNGKEKSKVNPEYPAEVRVRGVQGVVVVEVTIEIASGKVTEARAISGHELLREAAVAAVKKWTYSHTNDMPPQTYVVGTVDVKFTIMPTRRLTQTNTRRRRAAQRN